MTATLVASDLDRTLIYSPAGLLLAGADEDAPTLVSVEVLDGRPHSFMTERAVQLLAELSMVATFVPTTTRALSQYGRVRFPGVSPEWAITSNGGNVLHHGVPDEGWLRTVRAAIASSAADLATVRRELRHRADGDWVIKRRVSDDLFCYLVVELSELPADFLPAWRDWCTDHGWRVSVQGRKIYSIPQTLSKERAMAEVAARMGATRVLAAGDGALDIGFLGAADAAIRPPHGELHQLSWTTDGLTIAPTAGVLAGEEMLAWFLAQVLTDSVAAQQLPVT